MRSKRTIRQEPKPTQVSDLEPWQRPLDGGATVVAREYVDEAESGRVARELDRIVELRGRPRTEPDGSAGTSAMNPAHENKLR